MAFPPKHHIHYPSHLKLRLYNHLGSIKKMVKIMDEKDGLYWGDKERIKRAEEIRRKNKKKEVK